MSVINMDISIKYVFKQNEKDMVGPTSPEIDYLLICRIDINVKFLTECFFIHL